jgi:cell division protein FtsL
VTAREHRSLLDPRGPLPIAVLAAVVLLSALAVVRTKHENRALVDQLETLRREQERLHSEWAQLQIEEATLGHHSRVERIAREQLGMVEPRSYAVVGADTP